MRRVSLLLCLATLLTPTRASADVALLLGEAYGRFATFSPTGHAAVYLSRICATALTTLRRCEPGETGVVISRYHRVAGRDWIAIPLIPYLYAVDNAAQVPSHAARSTVVALRDQYRRSQLQELVPDTETGEAPKGDWFQLAGSAYDRRITALSLSTTPQQDDALIAALNARRNTERFNLMFRNCADFARDVINSYFPGALRSNAIADLGLTTPKQIAKSLVSFAEARPELGLRAQVIAQVPGSRGDSRGTRGIMESLVKTKKYVVPLAIVQPWVPVGLAAGYLMTGRFNPDRLATSAGGPAEIEHQALTAAIAK
jgi:hypothetical protein